MIFFQGSARPSLVVEVVPFAQMNAFALWQDDFTGEFAPCSIDFDAGAGLSIQSPNAIQIGSLDGFTFSSANDQPQITRTDSGNEEAIWTVTENDQYGALELEDNLPQPLLQFTSLTEDPWSIPRYKQAGQTLDCDTVVPLLGAQVFAQDAVTGRIIAQSSSDGVGAFSIPMFDQGPHLVRAVSGTKTAISLPVVAEGA